MSISNARSSDPPAGPECPAGGHLPCYCICFAYCERTLPFVPTPVELAVLSCMVAGPFDLLCFPFTPFLEGLRTAVPPFVFFGAHWSTVENADAACRFPADWPRAWICSPPPQLQPPEPFWRWVAFCVVRLVLPAVADDEASFDWST